MSEVSLEITAGVSMSSVLTIDSLNDSGIKEGARVKVIVKAVNVLLVKE